MRGLDRPKPMGISPHTQDLCPVLASGLERLPGPEYEETEERQSDRKPLK